MNIQLKKINAGKTVSKISFSLNVLNLYESINNCSINLGTIKDPIRADNFTTINEPIFSEFTEGETIEIGFNFDKEQGKENFSFISCEITNVGKDYINALTNPDEKTITLNSWKSIFDYKDKSNILSIPDGTLCLVPKNNKCRITINSAKPKPSKTATVTYISYSLTISMKYNSKIYYFKIDPLMKIISRH